MSRANLQVLKQTATYETKFKMLCVWCHQETLHKPQTSWVIRCKQCNKINCFYEATPFQVAMLTAPEKILIAMTSFGSGKTTASAYYWSFHLRYFKGSVVLAAAQNKEQMNKIVRKELDAFLLPDEFLKKNDAEWVLKNSSQIVFVADKHEQGIRSANASGLWIVEASKVKEAYYKEGLGRLRNNAVNVYATDRYGNLVYEDLANGTRVPKLLNSYTKVIIETNPDYGWVRNLLFKTKRTVITPSVKNKQLLLDKISPGKLDMVGFLATIEDNPYLSPSFIETNMKGRSTQERDMLLYCDLTNASSLVFELVASNKSKFFIAAPNQLQDHDVFLESIDPGGALLKNDATAYILAKYNKLTKQVVVLAAWKNHGTITHEDCERILKTRKQFNYDPDKSYFFTADTAINKASKEDGNSLASSYAVRLQTRIDTTGVKVGGIKKGLDLVKAYFSHNKILINEFACSDLWDEIKEYRYEVKSKFNETLKENVEELVLAGQDHLMDALRYLIVKLDSIHPLDENEISALIKENEILQEQKSKMNLWNIIAQQNELEAADEQEGWSGIKLTGA